MVASKCIAARLRAPCGDVSVTVRGSQVVAMTALDNLVKGAAGQALQNMNLMFGIEERTGLVLPGSNP